MKYIYGLIDPDDRSIRYVGQTTNLNRRHIEHVERNEFTPKGKWICRLRDQGKQPDIVCLEVVPDGSDVDLAEKWWLTLIEDHFFELTNGKNPSKKPVSFADMFSERLHREYNVFTAALKSQEPLVVITHAQFMVFVLFIKAILALCIGGMIGYGMWLIEYTASANEVMAVWQGSVAAISCTMMAAFVLYGLTRQRKFEIIYVTVMLFTSLYVTFGG